MVTPHPSYLFDNTPDSRSIQDVSSHPKKSPDNNGFATPSAIVALCLISGGLGSGLTYITTVTPTGYQSLSLRSLQDNSSHHDETTDKNQFATAGIYIYMCANIHISAHMNKLINICY